MENINYISIAKVVDSMDAAIEEAKARGNDIYAGYENEIAMAKRMAKEFNVQEWHITEKGTVLFVNDLGASERRMAGQKTLSKLSLGSSLTAAPLCLGHFSKSDGTLTVVSIAQVDKSDRKGRREACEKGLLLIDMYLAAELEREVA